MKKKGQTNHSIYGLMALLLFCVFAGCILSVLLSGADTYQRLVSRDQDTYGQRTCVQYISNRVRQTALPGKAEVTSFEGESCLVLPETIDGTEYVTRVYCYDGWIRELFTLRDGDFLPEEGEKLLEAEGLSFSIKSGLLSVELVDTDGEAVQWMLSLDKGRSVAS